MTNAATTPGGMLTLYADGPARLESVLHGLGDTDLALALDADSWSIRHIVHHLADGDGIWNVGIKAALGNSDGVFTLQWYWDRPQVDWSASWRYASLEIEASLAVLRANRRHMVGLLERIPDAWTKSIWLGSPNGSNERITVGWIVEMQARHVLDHIEDIQAVLDRHRR